MLDLPCFGSEPCPDSIWGVEEYAKFVKLKLEKFEVEKLVLLGHSFGGQVAAYLVSKYPDLCNGLILSGPAIYRKKNPLKNVIFLPIAKIGKVLFKLPLLRKFEKIAKRFLYRAADSPDYEQTSGIKRDIFKKIIKENISGELSRINIPTMIVWGDQDTFVPLRFAKKIQKQIENSETRIVVNGPHGLHLKKQKEFWSIINNFIAN